jgi:PAS domain-containing protein
LTLGQQQRSVSLLVSDVLAMSTSKSIQIILARQLASSIATPILLVDPLGTLIYYNEPAEAIFNQRFDETGELPASEWTALIAAVDDDRNPLPPDHRPMMRVLTERCPVSQTMWTRSSDGEWRHLRITAFPLIGEKDVLFGAMSIFWEI